MLIGDVTGEDEVVSSQTTVPCLKEKLYRCIATHHQPEGEAFFQGFHGIVIVSGVNDGGRVSHGSSCIKQRIPWIEEDTFLPPDKSPTH
jgi:hypothetical protein